jgi:phage tail-like protein
MPLEQFDSAAAYGFNLKLDGIEVPLVMEVSGLKAEVDKIQSKQQTADGKYIIRNIPGRNQAGEFTVTRGLTDSKTVSNWLKIVMDGDIKGARKNAEVGITDYKGETILRYTFENCWVKSVETGNLVAGDTKVLTEKFVVAFDTSKVE